MKKHGIIALVLAGILTASALTVGVSAANADTVPEASIEQEDSTAGKKAKNLIDNTIEDGALREIREKKAKKSADSAEEDGTVSEKKAKPEESADSTTENGRTNQKHGKKDRKVTEPEGTIGKDAAEEAALTDAGVQAERRVHGWYTEQNGVGVYKITFKAGGQRYKYRIDATTGKILNKSITEITE